MAKGNIKFQELKEQVGMSGEVNPIATISTLRPSLEESLEVRNRQQFINRYKWMTMSGDPFPPGFDPVLIERILYYRYSLIAFIGEDGFKFYTTPYALSGSIDVYGRYKRVIPLTFNGSVEVERNRETGEETEVQTDGNWITEDQYVPVYDIYDTDPVEQEGTVYQRCVILRDYTNANTQYGEPRYKLSRTYNSLECDIISLIRHNLIASARIYSYRVSDEGQKKTSLAELGDLEQELLYDDKMFFPVTSNLELQTIFEDKELDSQEYWECFVSADNLRENLMGIENNGIFNKKERELEGETEKEASQADLVYADGLKQRQDFCDLLNATFGTDIWCTESPTIDKVDLNDDNYERGNENESESTDQNI